MKIFKTIFKLIDDASWSEHNFEVIAKLRPNWIKKDYMKYTISKLN